MWWYCEVLSSYVKKRERENLIEREKKKNKLKLLPACRHSLDVSKQNGKGKT